MEIIGYGILLAIGWYIASFVIGLVFTGLAVIGYTICRIFGGCDA